MINNKSKGIASRMSVNRMMRVSTSPPKNPEIAPSTTPTERMITTEAKPAASEICPPLMIRE